VVNSVRCIAALLLLLISRPLLADPARFWISTSNSSSSGPVAPSITGKQGDINTLYIWAQPMTTGIGPWHATNNPFMTLQNISLNLTTNQPVVDFLNTGIAVPNPVLAGAIKRYQFVFDSNEGLTSSFSSSSVMSGSLDRINGIQAFTVEPGSTYLGVGPTRHANDTSSVVTTNGSPAWLISSVNYQIVAETGTTNFNLQVGGNGIRHAEVNSAGTNVLFGSNASTTEPIYNASTNRQMTLEDDLPDFTVTAVVTPPGDYNGDSTVNAVDYALWRDTLGSTTNFAADGNGNSSIDIGDYGVWKHNFGTSFGSGTSVAIPEPGSAVLLLLAAVAGLFHRVRSDS
jgi:hypothetical protein